MFFRRSSRLSAVLLSRAVLAPLAILVFAASNAYAQVSIPSLGTPVTENFDGMALIGGAALPTGFKVSSAANETDWNSGNSATTQIGGSTAAASAGGAYNWGDGAAASATDRAIGFLTSGSYTGSRSITYAFTNDTGATITDLVIKFDYEKYRSGTNVNGFGWNFFHGSSSTPATAAEAGNHSYPADANNAAVNPPSSESKTVGLTGLSIENGSTYYLRWQYTVGSGNTWSNAQGLAIDNFSITAHGAPAEPKVIISQVYSGGGSGNSSASFKQDFIELFNAGNAPANLSGLRLQYGSAGGTGNWNLGEPELPNFDLQPGQYYLIASGTAGTGGADFPLTPDHTIDLNLGAASGKLGLFDVGTAVSGICPDADRLDAVGWGSANCYEGAEAAPELSISLAAFRADGGCTDTDSNVADFSTGVPTPRNSASAFNVCDNGPGPTHPIVSFAAGTVSVAEGNAMPNTLTFTVQFTQIAEGEEVSFDIAVSGDDPLRFSYTGDSSVTLTDASVSPYLIHVQTVPNTDTDGDSEVTVTLSNFEGADEGQDDPIQKTGTIVDDDIVIAYIRINEVQGSGQKSPYEGQSITTRGVVTAITQGTPRFFIQSIPEDEDGDPATSEGLYVYGTPSPAVTLAVGDFVYVTGNVSEFIPATATQLPITELASGVSVTKVSSGNPLPEPVVLTAADTAIDSHLGTLERYEYMRVTVPSFIATAPSGAGTNDEFFGTLEGFDRPTREPGVDKFRCGVDPTLPGSRALPVEAPANVPCWDNNPELLRVKTNVIAGSTTLPVRTGTKFEDLTGILDYAFERYTILTTSTPVADTSSAENGTAVSVPGAGDITVGAFNVEWLGCPTLAQDPVNGSNSCNPRGGTAYNRKVAKIGQVIVDYLHSPDIIGIIEGYDTLVLGDIAQKVAEVAGANDPQYVAVQASTTTGAQRLGFLIKTSLVGDTPRVTLDGVATEYGAGMLVQCPDGTYTEAPAPGQRPGLLNDRPPQVIDVTIRGENGQDFPLTVVNNHLKAMGDHENTGPAGGAYTCFNFAADGVTPVADGDGIRNRAKRQQNAEYLAELAQWLQEENPNRPIVLIGDFNAYEFNDGYADLTNTVAGTPPSDDETVVPDDGVDFVDPDFVILAKESPTPVYSYTFQGVTQTIDQILVSEATLAQVVGIPRIEYARVNADFHQGDATNTGNAFASSDHDPSLAYLDVAAFRNADLSLDTTPAAAEAEVGDELTYAFVLTNDGPDDAALVRVELSLPAGVLFMEFDAPAGWACDAPAIGTQGVVVCTVDLLAVDAEAAFSVTALADTASHGTTAVATLSVSSGSLDETPVEDATFTTVIAALPYEIFSNGFED